MRARSREAEQGDPAARRALLRERLRAGQVGDAQLRLAAFLGDAAAADVIEAPPATSDLSGWLEPMRGWDLPTCARAAHAAAALLLPIWEACGGGASVVRTLEDLSRWVRCPCRKHQDDVGASLDVLRSASITAGGPGVAVNAGRAADCALRAAVLSQWSPGDWHGSAAREVLLRAAQVPADVIEAGSAWAECPCDDHARTLLAVLRAVPVATEGRWPGEDQVRRAVRDALVPWLLGDGDPLEPRARRRGV